MIGCVYLVLNSANGSAYIGKALKGLAHRKEQHINACRRGEDWAFYRAMRKYGEAAFQTWVVLFASDDDGALLDAERALIADYRAAGVRLYNSTDGGQGTAGRKASAETRAKIAAKARERRHSPEHRARISMAGKGKVRSEEFKRNLAESKRRYWADRCAKGLGGHARTMTEEGRRILSDNAKARWERRRNGDTSCIGKPIA